MKAIFEIILDIIHSIRGLIYFFLFFFVLILLVGAAQAQDYHSPIKELHKMSLKEEAYSPEQQVYIKVYTNGVSDVYLRMTNIDTASYRLHKNQKTIPTISRDLIFVRINGVNKMYWKEEILKYTKQIK